MMTHSKGESEGSTLVWQCVT